MSGARGGWKRLQQQERCRAFAKRARELKRGRDSHASYTITTQLILGPATDSTAYLSAWGNPWLANPEKLKHAHAHRATRSRAFPYIALGTGTGIAWVVKSWVSKDYHVDLPDSQQSWPRQDRGSSCKLGFFLRVTATFPIQLSTPTPHPVQSDRPRWHCIGQWQLEFIREIPAEWPPPALLPTNDSVVRAQWPSQDLGRIWGPQPLRPNLPSRTYRSFGGSFDRPETSSFHQ